MQHGMQLFGAALALLVSLPHSQGSAAHIRVDPFGYRPDARKVAILREPVAGYDAPDPFTPGAVIELRRTGDDSLAFSAAPRPWNAGSVHAQSGDRVWWLDFTALRKVGAYYVLDPSSGQRSESFRIAPNVYEKVLEDAVRAFFYQRSGFAKTTPFADPKWADGASHLGPQQDLDCRAVLNPTLATSRDLSGGWFDAGDYNKYVNFADGAVHELLAAYSIAPTRWGDDFNLPESGNGIPDLLDEVRWELDWLLRMQNADGSVLHKVSVTNFAAASPPSADTAFRRYAPATASATISACGVFARAATVYGSLPDAAMQSYAQELENAAVQAWSWLESNPGQVPSSYDNAGFLSATAEDSPYEQDMNRLRAATWLLRATGEGVYRDYVDANYLAGHLFQWLWASPFEREANAGLLEYTQAPGATAAVVADIRTTYAAVLSGPDHLGHVVNETDAYLSYFKDQDYVWGTNRTKAQQGLMFLDMNRYGLDPANARAYRDAAADYLHWVHGTSPTGYCMLTNMQSRGASSSVTEMYHAWFADGTIWDSSVSSPYGPAPAYLVGGVNPTYAPDGAYVGPPIAPPQNQPIQKSYKDWNTGYPQNSWQVTEPSITYQAPYVHLLAEITLRTPPRLGLAAPATAAPR